MPKPIDRPKPQPVAAQPPTSAAQSPLEAPDAPELTERQRELLAYLRSRSQLAKDGPAWTQEDLRRENYL